MELNSQLLKGKSDLAAIKLLNSENANKEENTIRYF